MKHSEIYRWLDALAPFETQEDFDNSGFLVGDPAEECRGVLFALDVTPAVLQEAERLGVSLIITHHPLMFSAIRRLTEETFEGRLISRMIRGHLSLIAAHTNLDQAPGGINDALCAAIGLRDVSGESFWRAGRLAEPLPLNQLVFFVEARLHTVVRRMGELPAGTRVERVGVCSGGGSEFWPDALSAGAQVFLTGEIKHHHALAMTDVGLVGLEAGHFATENPGILAQAERLRCFAQEQGAAFPIHVSQMGAYAAPV